ncbi:MAG TPA: sigma-70 family RNA polymerase sigma factor [Cyclobacteriaceae bacterium]|nr:sigma-70 family RNA polymerase sigma factor [Cyclobacteriaceae bacterium]
MDQPDKLLLESFRRGEGHALDKIYEYYRMPVIRFTVSIVKDEQEAENIYHEVFIKLLKKKEDIKPELNFNSYVFTAVRNEIFDFLKAVKKDSVFKEKYWEKIQAQRMEVEEDKEEVLSRLEGIVQMLSPKRRRILEMNYYEQKSYIEIAEALRISKNTVKNQLVKAKYIIRREME